MLLRIPDLLTADELQDCRALLEQAQWVDGTATAGFQSSGVKRNEQIAEASDEARALGEIVLDALDRNLLFNASALPARVFPPLFNRYREADSFGNHVDNAIRRSRATGARIRTDLSATLFFSEPEDYDGGELVIDDIYGPHAVKLPAGHMVLYPASSLHRVQPVTRGCREASFFWVQSLVRDDTARALLFDMDMAIVQLRQRLGDEDSVLGLTNVYHNLLRRWATV